MDSESDWDSPTERAMSPKDGPPKIELTSGEEAISPRKPKPRQGLKMAPNKDVKFNGDKQDKNVDKQLNQRKPQDDGPPYDFRSEIADGKESPVNIRVTEPPGVSRKGDLYDPGQKRSNSSHTRKDSWEDSDGENNMLAELRETYEKNKPRSMFNKDSDISRSKVERSPSRKSDKAKMKGVAKRDALPSGTEAGANESDVVVGVAQQKLSSKHNKEKKQTSPACANLDIQIVDAKVLNEPANNVVDSYGNKRVYIFDGPVTEYYRTNIEPDVPKAHMEKVADVVEKWIYRGWKEFFGVLRIVFSFFTISILELYKFTFGKMLMPCVIKMTDMTGGYIIKPFLATFFNNVLQPFFVFLHNVGNGVSLVLMPIIDVLKAIGGIVAKILSAFRLVTVSIDKRHIDHVDTISNV